MNSAVGLRRLRSVVQLEPARKVATRSNGEAQGSHWARLQLLLSASSSSFASRGSGVQQPPSQYGRGASSWGHGGKKRTPAIYRDGPFPRTRANSAQPVPASQTCTEPGRPTGLKANERTTLFTTGAEGSSYSRRASLGRTVRAGYTKLASRARGQGRRPRTVLAAEHHGVSAQSDARHLPISRGLPCPRRCWLEPAQDLREPLYLLASRLPLSASCSARWEAAPRCGPERDAPIGLAHRAAGSRR